MGQKAHGQSYCRLFKSNISLEQNDEIVWFYACWCDSKIGCISKNQKWVWPLKSWDSAVSQEWIDEFACWYKFRKAKVL